MFLVEIQEQFNAGHSVQVPGGAWEKPHVHQWRLRIFLTRRRLNKYHMVVDFHLAKKILRSVLEDLTGRRDNERQKVLPPRRSQGRNHAGDARHHPVRPGRAPDL